MYVCLVTLITRIMVTSMVIPTVLLFFGIVTLISINAFIIVRAIRSLRNRRPAERGISSFPVSGNGVGMSQEVSGNDVGMSQEEVSGNGVGMSQEEVQKLPSFEYKHGGMYIMLHRMLCKDDDHNDDGIENGSWMHELDCLECAVCLDGFQTGETCRLLPLCRHTFHAKCVDSWLYKSPLCPICRTSARQHGGERGTVVIDNALELAQVGGCEMGSGTRDIAIGIALQGGLRGDRRSGFHPSEMSNLVSNTPSSSRSFPTDAYMWNLISTASLPLQYRSNDDGGGGVTAIDVLNLNQSQSQSPNSQSKNQNSCKSISVPIPSCRANGDEGMRGFGVLSPSQSQNQNQNSCNSMSIPMPTCKPPDDDGVRINGTSIAIQSQNQNQIVCDSTLFLPPHLRPPDDEGVRVIGVTCPVENQIQSLARDGDAMA